MSGLACVTDAERQGPVFLNPHHIPSVQEISGGTEITLTLFSFAVVVALLMELANICDALRKKLARAPSSPTHRPARSGIHPEGSIPRG